jgi:hypothetical protein
MGTLLVGYLASLIVSGTGRSSQPLGGAAGTLARGCFYLGFYPLTYVAAVIFMRGEVSRLSTPTWLDGAVASVGTASVCAAFVFDRVLRLTGGNSLATATNLAYPIGDVLLLSLVVGGSTVMCRCQSGSGRARRTRRPFGSQRCSSFRG